MIDQLVDVFRATYIGVGAHPKLLIHAVEEVNSYITRIYRLVWILFPIMPKIDAQPKLVVQWENEERFDDEDDESSTLVSRFNIFFFLLTFRSLTFLGICIGP